IVANNTYPADFGYQNQIIQTNLIHASWENKVKRLLFLGSSCLSRALTNAEPTNPRCPATYILAL
ncbi:NAD-dependent epimerase/dehydratase family protein, partial [Legionella sp. 29fVS95]|uniref:NAD-dependent epimerase/dehydratase family protein n=1 Tax=Legionella sp. 29fVS95 TaxID=3402813 RepID=UPI003AF97D05